MVMVVARVGELVCTCRAGCLEHAMRTMARLVKALLGDGAVASGKVECGPQLQVLGVIVVPSNTGFQCRLSPEKAEKMH